MRILVTNDDGIERPGPAALVASAVAAGHEVTVVAPVREMSGSGASMGSLALHEPIQLRRHRLAGFDDVPAYAAAATPAACVILACLGAVGEPPDLVLSGINSGFNVGRSALHSGTLGAALTAAAWGTRGLAVSTGYEQYEHLSVAAEVALALAGPFAQSTWLRTLNVNVPHLPRRALRGARWATLAPLGSIRSIMTGVEEAAAGDGFWVHTDHEPTDPASVPPGSDRALVADGWVTLTGLAGLAENNAGDPGDDTLLRAVPPRPDSPQRPPATPRRAGDSAAEDGSPR